MSHFLSSFHTRASFYFLHHFTVLQCFTSFCSQQVLVSSTELSFNIVPSLRFAASLLGLPRLQLAAWASLGGFHSSGGDKHHRMCAECLQQEALAAAERDLKKQTDSTQQTSSKPVVPEGCWAANTPLLRAAGSFGIWKSAWLIARVHGHDLYFLDTSVPGFSFTHL